MKNKNSITNLEELFQYFLLTEQSMKEIEESGIIANKIILNRNNETYLLLFTRKKINDSSVFLYKMDEIKVYDRTYNFQKI